MSEPPDSDSSHSTLRSVTRGASVYFLGTGANKILRFIINLLLTRWLGAALYGIYTYGNTLMSMASILTRLGTGKSILKFIPQYEGDRANQNRILGLAYATSFVASLIVAAGLYLLAPTITELTLGRPLLTDVLRLFAIILPFNTFINIIASVFQSIELPEYQMLSSTVALPAFRLVTIGVAIVLGASLIGVVAAMIVAWVLTFGFAVALFLSRTDFRPTFRSSRKEMSEFYNFSVPLTFSQAGSFFQNRVDILMVGFFLSGSAVGIYNIATVLSRFLTMPLLGFSQMFPPIASRLYTNGELAELESLFARVTRWSFTLSLLPFLGALIYRREVLAIFGETFATGAGVLALFAFAQLTNATVGPSGYVLMMTGHQYLTMVNKWVLGVSNIVLNYLFIMEFGLIGAALATASTLSAVRRWCRSLHRPSIGGSQLYIDLISIHHMTRISRNYLQFIRATQSEVNRVRP
jgi:O-antigen/teichoic acid export membrane protein